MGVNDDNASAEAIELRVNEIGQLFHSLDPFPFRERDHDKEAEDYMVSRAREIPTMSLSNGRTPNRRESMSRLGPVTLIGALTCLAYSHQSNAAVGVAPSVADSLQGVVEPVHYSRRYGWHCGMWKSYGHEHKESCHRAGGYWGDREEGRYGAWRRRLFGAGGRPVEN